MYSPGVVLLGSWAPAPEEGSLVERCHVEDRSPGTCLRLENIQNKCLPQSPCFPDIRNWAYTSSGRVFPSYDAFGSLSRDVIGQNPPPRHHGIVPPPPVTLRRRQSAFYWKVFTARVRSTMEGYVFKRVFLFTGCCPLVSGSWPLPSGQGYPQSGLYPGANPVRPVAGEGGHPSQTCSQGVALERTGLSPQAGGEPSPPG